MSGIKWAPHRHLLLLFFNCGCYLNFRGRKGYLHLDFIVPFHSYPRSGQLQWLGFCIDPAWISNCSWPPQSMIGFIFLSDLFGSFQRAPVEPKYIISIIEVITKGEKSLQIPYSLLQWWTLACSSCLLLRYDQRPSLSCCSPLLFWGVKCIRSLFPSNTGCGKGLLVFHFILVSLFPMDLEKAIEAEQTWEVISLVLCLWQEKLLWQYTNKCWENWLAT